MMYSGFVQHGHNDMRAQQEGAWQHATQPNVSSPAGMDFTILMFSLLSRVSIFRSKLIVLRFATGKCPCDCSADIFLDTDFSDRLLIVGDRSTCFY